MNLLPDLLTHQDFTVAELSACSLDGEVTAIDNAYIITDMPEGKAVRARAVGHNVDDRCVAASWSAAWIHDAIPFPPLLHTVALRDGLRLRFDPAKRYSIAQMSFGLADVEGSPGAYVTTPLRTAVDLARFTAQDARLTPALMCLLRLAKAQAEDVSEILERAQHLPHKKRAYRRLGAALAFAHAVDIVDGVNPANAVKEPIQMDGVTHFKNEPTQSEAFV
jgi:hypothetical protein